MHSLLYLLAILTLSQAGNLARFSEAAPEILGFWRMGIASLLLLVFLAISKWRKRNNILQLSTPPNSFDFKTLFWPILSGLFFFIHLWTYKFGAQNTRIANSMIIFATNPVWTSIITILFMKEKFHWRYLFSFCFGFISLYILLKDKLSLNIFSSWNQLDKDSLGQISAIFAAIFYSLYIITGKKARHHLETTLTTFIIYSTAALFFLLLCLNKMSPFDLMNLESKAWFGIALLVIFPTLLGHSLFTYLLHHLNINWMSTGKLAEPVFASIMAFYLFQEDLSADAGWAFFFIVISLLILLKPEMFTFLLRPIRNGKSKHAK